MYLYSTHNFLLTFNRWWMDVIEWSEWARDRQYQFTSVTRARFCFLWRRRQFILSFIFLLLLWIQISPIWKWKRAISNLRFTCASNVVLVARTPHQTGLLNYISVNACSFVVDLLDEIKYSILLSHSVAWHNFTFRPVRRLLSWVLLWHGRKMQNHVPLIVV